MTPQISAQKIEAPSKVSVTVLSGNDTAKKNPHADLGIPSKNIKDPSVAQKVQPMSSKYSPGLLGLGGAEFWSCCVFNVLIVCVSLSIRS